MIPSDETLVLFEQDTYAANPSGQVIDTGPDRTVISHINDTLLISGRGTTNEAGWWSDFHIAPRVAATHPQIGVCEQGFLKGSIAVYGVIKPILLASTHLTVVIQGHSRYAAMAAQIAAMAICDELMHAARGDRIVCWEKPWGNGSKMRSIIEESKIAGIEYWHGDDPVPLAPAEPWLVMSNLPIHHFGRWTLNPIDSHLMDGIVTDVKAGALRA